MFSITKNDFIIKFPNGLSLRTFVEAPNSKIVSISVYNKDKKNCTDEVLRINKNIVHGVDIGQWYTIVQCIANYVNPIKNLQQVFDSLSAEQQAVLKDYLPKEVSQKKSPEGDVYSFILKKFGNQESDSELEDIYTKLLQSVYSKPAYGVSARKGK